jgi:DNA-binding transcriptional ArsR family regulator
MAMGKRLAPGRRSVLIYNHMVVGLLTDERADRVFHALADATRRDIVVRTLAGEHSVSALARHYPMSFAAVQKHVAVLAEAGLVTKHRKGREQIVRADVDTIRRANRLLDGLEAAWRGRVERMGEILADDPMGGTR